MSPAQPYKTRTAFSIWGKRIAPVFDVARPVHVMEAESGQILSEWHETLPDDSPVQKALCLAELEVTTLVCGAITRPLHSLITAYGIEVIPFLAGDLREVIQARLEGTSLEKVFAMPGCCGGGRHRMRGSDSVDPEVEISASQYVGGGRSGRSRQGRYGRVCNRSVDLGMEETTGVCICPQCGHKQPHQYGIRCYELICPKCGAVMTRE